MLYLCVTGQDVMGMCYFLEITILKLAQDYGLFQLRSSQNNHNLCILSRIDTLWWDQEILYLLHKILVPLSALSDVHDFDTKRQLFCFTF